MINQYKFQCILGEDGGTTVRHWTSDVLQLTGSVTSYSAELQRPRQVVHVHEPLFTKWHELVLATGSNNLKLTR